MYALSPPICCLLQVTGLLPVEVQTIPPRKLIMKSSLSRRIFSIICALLICISFYSWIWQLLLIKVPELSIFWGSLSTATMVSVVVCNNVTISLAALACLLVAVFRVQLKMQLLENLREVEFMLRSQDNSHNTRTVTYLALANTAVAAIYTVFRNVYDMALYDAFFVVCKVLIICGVIEWAELVLSIKDRFQLVNARFEEVVARSRSKELLWTVAMPCVEGFSMPQELSITVVELNEVHWKLCCIVYDVNAIYGSQLVFNVFFLFSHLICHPYFFFLLIANEGFIDDITSMLIFMDWLLVYITTLFLIMGPCSSTVSEAKRTVAVITKLMGNKIGRPMFDQLKVVAKQLFHRHVEFSACGLFTLQSSIIVTIASAVSTYMAVIIQFQISAQSDDDDDEVILPS